MRLHAYIRGRAAYAELGEVPYAVGAITRADDIQVRLQVAHQLREFDDTEHVVLRDGPRRPEGLRRDDAAGVTGRQPQEPGPFPLAPGHPGAAPPPHPPSADETRHPAHHAVPHACGP